MKKERLRELRKSRNGNQLFYQMSLFFHRKKEIIDTLHKKKEELIDKVSRITNRHFRKECFHKLQKEKLALGKQLEQDPR